MHFFTHSYDCTIKKWKLRIIVIMTMWKKDNFSLLRPFSVSIVHNIMIFDISCFGKKNRVCSLRKCDLKTIRMLQVIVRCNGLFKYKELLKTFSLLRPKVELGFSDHMSSVCLSVCLYTFILLTPSQEPLGQILRTWYKASSC